MLARNRRRSASGAAALAIVVVTAAGCSSGHTAASAPKKPALTGPQLLDAVVKSTASVKSFSGTMSMQGTANGANIAMSGTMSEQKKPLAVQATFGSIKAAGHSMGPISMLMTPREMYLKMPPSLTKGQLKTPWMGMPLSALKAGGTSLSSLINEANNNPLSQTQMLAAAPNTRIVGTGTVGGVPVTEIAGTESVTQALASSKLPAAVRTRLSQEVEKAGLGQIKFSEWIDAQHNLRKAIITEIGSMVSETITMTVTSINQPVNVTPPPSSQVTQIPASALSGSSGL